MPTEQLEAHISSCKTCKTLAIPPPTHSGGYCRSLRRRYSVTVLPISGRLLLRLVVLVATIYDAARSLVRLSSPRRTLPSRATPAGVPRPFSVSTSPSSHSVYINLVPLLIDVVLMARIYYALP